MTKKIIKRKCGYHAHPRERDISEFTFWLTDYKGRDIYECTSCKEHLERAIDRSDRIRDHNRAQETRAYDRRISISNKKLKKRTDSMKNDLWDVTVRKELSKGLKLSATQRRIFEDALPKELLQLKRAMMKFDRLIKSIKESPDHDIIEEIALPEILRNCSKHGELYLDGVIKSGKNTTGRQKYKCKQCQKDLHKNYYERQKEHVLAKCAEYRRNNPEKVKEIKSNWKMNNVKDRKHERPA